MEKRCPTCNRSYVERDINYCLADGSFLLAPHEATSNQAPPTLKITDAPTEVMPRSQQNVPTEVMHGAVPATAPPAQARITSSRKPPVLNPWLIAFLAVCIVAFIIALLLMLSWRNSATDTRPLASGQSVEGTAWAGMNGTEDITIEFLSNGQVHYKTNLAMTTQGDTWSQKGDAVIINRNGGYAIHEGTIKGNQIEFKARNKDNYKWDYTVTRIR